MSKPRYSKRELNLIRLLAVQTRISSNAHLVGNPSMSVKKRYERMKSLQPGDMVIEVSNLEFWQKPSYEPNLDCLGRLIGVAEEPVPNWDEQEEGRPAPLESFWYLETWQGTLARWENCRFLLLFEDWIDDLISHQDSDEIPTFTGSFSRSGWVQEAKARHGITGLAWRTPPFSGGF